METVWTTLIFRVPNSKSADARDGILLLGTTTTFLFVVDYICVCSGL